MILLSSIYTPKFNKPYIKFIAEQNGKRYAGRVEYSENCKNVSLNCMQSIPELLSEDIKDKCCVKFTKHGFKFGFMPKGIIWFGKYQLII